EDLAKFAAIERGLLCGCDFRMGIIIEHRRQTELRSAACQRAALQSKGIRCGFEFGFEAVNHRIQILKMNLSIFVAQAAGIALGSRIETRLKFEIMEIRVESALVIVVVNLALPDLDVTDAEVEDACLLAAALKGGQVRDAV